MNKADDQLPYYVHEDISGTSFEQFSELFDTPAPMSDDFIENLEWALMYLDMNKSGTPFGYDETRQHFFSLSTFDGAYLMNAGKIGASDKNDLLFFNPLFENFDLSMFDNWNVKAMAFSDPDANQMPVSLKKLRLLDDKEKRKFGKQAYTLPIAEFSHAYLSKTEKWFTLREGYGLLKIRGSADESGNNLYPFGPVPVSLDPRYYIKSEHQKAYIADPTYYDILTTVNMMLGLRFTLYYEWMVYIRETPTALGVKIPIVPESSKEVFALRNIPEGAQRKKAICNFVREHYRTVKCDYDPGQREVLVKQHFRGETKFNWRGLEVNIIPAEYDLMRIRTSKKFIKK